MRLTPRRVLVTCHGRTRVRVQGRNVGFVRVASARRWVWGAFDETFVVDAGSGGVIEVVLVGVLGRAVEEIAVGAHVDIAPPAARVARLVAARPAVSCVTPRIGIRVPTAPRLRSLLA